MPHTAGASCPSLFRTPHRKEVASLLSDMARQLEEGNIVSIQGFGTFEVKKKAERISVHPTKKQRMLVPPKLVLTYKPSTLLKDKFK